MFIKGLPEHAARQRGCFFFYFSVARRGAPVQGNRRLSPVAIIVVSVCVVSHALRVHTHTRTFNTCVRLHPTVLRGNSVILHTFLNLGWRISSMQAAQWRISSKHPFHEQQYSIITTSMKDRAEGIAYYSAS